MSAELAVAIAGVGGQMGTAVATLAADRPALRPVLGFSTAPAEVDAPVEEVLEPAAMSEALSAASVDVLIEFTTGGAVGSIAATAAAAAVPLVSGTTGLTAADRSGLEAAAAAVPVLHATNFSRGIAVLRGLLREAVMKSLRPAAAAETAAATTPAAPQQRFAARALLAEDNPVNQKVIRMMLERCGIGLEIVGDGEQAAAAVAGDHGFDVIFMDVQMPVLSGLDAARRIRAHERRHGLPAIPIIAMTAAARAEDREACLEAGMDDFVSKPATGDRDRPLAARQGAMTAGPRLADRPRGGRAQAHGAPGGALRSTRSVIRRSRSATAASAPSAANAGTRTGA
jgi:CheY-like chemotaxis protein